MTSKAKKRLLDILGFLISVLLPVAAAIAVFPREPAKGFADWLNISSAAFAVVLVVGAFAAVRFFHDRLHMPKNGVVLALLLYALIRGIKVIIDPFEVIAFWMLVGNLVGWLCYLIADKKFGGDKNGTE